MMNNRIIQFYKPALSLSRIFFHRQVNNQTVPNTSLTRIFSEQIRLDVKTIETIWRNNRNKKGFEKHLCQRYVQSPEFVTYAIDLINCVCSRKVNELSTCLVFDIVQSLSNYVSNNKIVFTPTIDQKIDVLSSVLALKNYQIIQLVRDVFQINDQSVHFKKFIKNLIEQHKFTEAAYIVSVLHLQNEYDMKEIVYPLLLEGKASTVNIYLKGYPDMQFKAAKFLDDCVQRDVVPVDLKSRRAHKTLSSLINLCKIPLDYCPNMQFIRSRSAISILLDRRAQQSVSEATWEEMVKNIIGDNEDLKRFLIKKLIRKKDITTAQKMTKRLNVSDPDLFTELNSESLGDQSKEFQMTHETEIFEEYLKFDLTSEDITLVDNKENFINCINEICQNYRIVGIDSEWKPNFGLSRDRLALIQLAGHDKVFVFDVLLLSECLEADDWDKFLDDIFGNPNIIKLGFGIMSDVNMILESIKGTKGKTVKFSHILDMSLFYLKLLEVYPVEMKIDNDKDFTKSLSSLCDIVLGYPLSKEERLCDWEKRPLQTKQLEYASLDAYCLLQVYDKLKEDSVLKNMNFEHLSKVAIVITTSQWKSKRKFKGIRNEKEFHVKKIIPVSQLKLVMDSTFERQGKELRKLGADIIILDKTNSADDAVELSRTGRIIVCSDEMHDQVKHRVNDGVCCHIETQGNELKVSNFLEHFNAVVSMKNLYSRCMNCNSNDGMKLSTEDVKALHELCSSSDTINSDVTNNLTCFSSEFQETFYDILKLKIDIKFSFEGTSSHLNQFAFLCKKCGSIS